MTGVSWGNYQDYLYGRFDGVNHEDEAQTDRDGQEDQPRRRCLLHVPRRRTSASSSAWACSARSMPGAEAMHLEEPEFWVRGGYSEGFKREWQQLLRRRLAAAAQLAWMPNGAPRS